MKKKTNLLLKYCYLISISVFLLSCQANVQENKDCFKFANEIYPEEVPDTSLKKEVFDCQKNLLERFGETSVKGLNYEAYHLQFYSAHGFGQSVKFENKNGVCSITVKCRTTKDWLPDCKEYEIGIDWKEWDVLEKMIYEFNFWTAVDFKANKDVLDGFVYLLEGNRPEAEKCGRKTYKLVARSSPSYDKIGALCQYIREYEDQLKFRYEQRGKIN